MRKTPAIALFILCLAFSAYAQEIPNPPTQQAASFDSMVRSIQELKEEVGTLRKELAETKGQIQPILEYQYGKLLTLLLIWTMLWTVISRLVGRIGNYLAERRFERATQNHKERVLHELKEIRAEIEAIVGLLHKVDQGVKQVCPPTPTDAPKDSFWDRLPWRRKK